jgi:hypothetical protein
MKLATLDDVRRLVAKHLPAEYRSKFAWRKFAALLRRAAQGKHCAAEVSTALQIILKIERVPFQVQSSEPLKPIPRIWTMARYERSPA